MPKSTRVLKNVVSDLKKLEVQKEKLNSEFWQHINKTFHPLPHHRIEFQEMRNKLVRLWEEAIKERGSDPKKKVNYKIVGDSLKNSLDGFAEHCRHEGSWNLFVEFVLGINELESKLIDAMDNSEVEWDRSDDSFSDFTDILTLAPPFMIDKILQMGYKSNAALEKDLRKNLKKWLAETVVDGENYLSMRLMEMVEEYFPG